LFAKEKNTGEGLAAFIRIGISDNSVNRVNGYYGAGINYTGLIPGREEDVFGIALAAAHNAGDFRNAEAAAGNIIKEYEYIWEVTYEINLEYGFKVQPDFQFVKNPADCYRNDYCTIIGTRLQYNLN
jgi:porin